MLVEQLHVKAHNAPREEDSKLLCGKNAMGSRKRTALARGLLHLILLPLSAYGLVAPLAVQAQQLQRVEIPSSFNPVGSGARALGMGGAFIAVADDATAASWNPGGLIQLEHPEISVVGAYFYRREDNTFGANPEASGEQSASEVRINYLSFSYPFSFLERNMIVSINYQNMFDLTREWDFPLFHDSGGLKMNQEVHYDQEGTLSAFGLAYAIQLTPQLSLGFTLNLWEDGLYENEWKQSVTEKSRGTLNGIAFRSESRSEDEFSLSGFNANIGILWNMTPKLTLGAVFKTPFTADIKHRSEFESSLKFPASPGFASTSYSSFEEDEELDMPMSYGIGLAYRYSDSFTAAFDIYRTAWDDFELKDGQGNAFSPISGRPSSESDIDPTHQVRIGAEYLIITPKYIIPLRAGLFYDPAPAEGSPDDFFGFSIGSGIAVGRWIFDMAYQYRFGNDVGKSMIQNLDFSQDVEEHTLYSSLIVHF
jgi:long-subunit fatty acid transport protein